MSFLELEPSSSTALVDASDGHQISFRGIIERGREVAGRLGPGRQLLLLVAHNDPFTAVTYWGCLDAGHPVALLDDHGSDGTVVDLVNAYRPAWLAGPAGLGARLAARGLDIASIVGVEHGELAHIGRDPGPELHPELALLLTTSGTTGSQKFVRLSRRNVESNASSIAACLDLSSEDRPITSLPLHYSFGLSVLNSHWGVGAAVVLTSEGVVQRTFWETFSRESCTSLAGVPYTYQMLERIGFRQLQLPSLQSLQQAGGALDHHLKEIYRHHMADLGGRFFVMYGQTEATARIACVPPSRLEQKIGSAGQAIPGGTLRIEPDPAGNAIGKPGPDTPGEVIYEGPNVMLGYASGAEDLRRGDELGGVLPTGDIGYLDEEGFLFLIGRSKRIAKVFGHRVNLDEIEMLVRERGLAACVGGVDAVWAFCAFGTDDSIELLRREIAQRLGIHYSGLQFRRVDAIPVVSSGKFDYSEIQRWADPPGSNRAIPSRSDAAPRSSRRDLE